MSIIETHNAIKPRIIFMYGVIGLMIIVLFCGLTYRQVLSNTLFVESERIQNQRRILIPGPRGEIYDREGRVLVANRPRFSAVLFFSDEQLRQEFRQEYLRVVRDIRNEAIPEPPEGRETKARANVLQRYLDQCGVILGRFEEIDTRKLRDHFHQQPLIPFKLLDDLTLPEFAMLLEQLPPASPIQIYPTTARHYPYGSAASHVLGYVTSTLDLPETNLPGADLTTFYGRGSLGRDGLEKQFDDRLQGHTGSEIWIVDPAGFQVRLIDSKAPVSGGSVQSSLDIDLQLTAERAFGEREGSLVLIDVNTGEILAMVSKPDYDLNDLTPFISRDTFADIEDRGAWINRATQGLYPPGSPFKLITALAGMRAGTLDPEAEVVCTGYFEVGNRMFPCHNRAGHGPMNLQRAIASSCNPYFYKNAIDAGVDFLAAESKRFGFDTPTGIELPGEATRMIVPDRNWKRSELGIPWFPGDTANMAIGQGYLRVTPLQMACFTASIARGETLTKPTLLRRDSGVPPAIAGNQNLGIPPQFRTAFIEGMKMSATIGTGRFVTRDAPDLRGVELAGKTGTAQVRTPRGTLELAWFIGFGPVVDSDVAIAVVVVGEQPDESNAGGSVAAPIAGTVLNAFFSKHPPAPLANSTFTAPPIQQ